ncbi:sensor domain-containing diguanylate cyclase [Vibrio diazotrophicus]|uniref:sensor domain-containing diguanylate cyclase n=1 Tax=Vibrio diazotrophicus TaxID=685 RepID=UPI00142D37F1|nr:sensor domain-containing diguanylate cyclase [Vibrio diazotrophicus]NIY91945.1 GGDEF domain-containing protein [Vibrio diazotrophicus]
MEMKDRYFTVLDSLPDHVFIFSESGIYVDVYGGDDNDTGFDCKPFIGLSLYDVAPPQMAKEFHSYILAALKTNKTQTAIYKFDKQDMIDLPEHVPTPQEIWFEGIIKPLPLIENGERTVVWIAKNVTKRHLLEQRLKELSEIDDLTGIANRRSFTHSLSEALKEYHLFNRSFSVLMLDIDRFKRINDLLGHSCGDEAIQYAVQVIKGELRESDCFGRIGGEEFAVILYDTELNNAMSVAEKLRIILEKKHFIVNNNEIELTISIGVTQVIKDDGDIKSILARADKAMYNSKKAGRNKVSPYSYSYE